MFTFETGDQKIVRRFRIAQFNGRTVTATPDGISVTGHVRSIVQNETSHPAKWVITLVPNARTLASRPFRYVPHQGNLAEEMR